VTVSNASIDAWGSQHRATDGHRASARGLGPERMDDEDWHREATMRGSGERRTASPVPWAPQPLAVEEKQRAGSSSSPAPSEQACDEERSVGCVDDRGECTDGAASEELDRMAVDESEDNFAQVSRSSTPMQRSSSPEARVEQRASRSREQPGSRHVAEEEASLEGSRSMALHHRQSSKPRNGSSERFGGARRARSRVQTMQTARRVDNGEAATNQWPVVDRRLSGGAWWASDDESESVDDEELEPGGFSRGDDEHTYWADVDYFASPTQWSEDDGEERSSTTSNDETEIVKIDGYDGVDPGCCDDASATSFEAVALTQTQARTRAHIMRMLQDLVAVAGNAAHDYVADYEQMKDLAYRVWHQFRLDPASCESFAAVVLRAAIEAEETVDATPPSVEAVSSTLIEMFQSLESLFSPDHDALLDALIDAQPDKARIRLSLRRPSASASDAAPPTRLDRTATSAFSPYTRDEELAVAPASRDAPDDARGARGDADSSTSAARPARLEPTPAESVTSDSSGAVDTDPPKPPRESAVSREIAPASAPRAVAPPRAVE